MGTRAGKKQRTRAGNDTRAGIKTGIEQETKQVVIQGGNKDGYQYKGINGDRD